MLDEFIQHTVAHIDDLSELKVSLVAIRLLELKHSETASTTQRELEQLPALREGLGFAPEIALESALKRTVIRGTLLACTAPSLDETRYFLNTPEGRRAVDAIELSEAHRSGSYSTLASQSTGETLYAVCREIERLDLIDVYPVTPNDETLIEEWLARGYSQDEILRAVRTVLAVPRLNGTPARTVHVCAPEVIALEPANPSAYYRTIITHATKYTDEIIAYHELTHRLPDGHAYNLLQAAVGIFGGTATVTMMSQMLSSTDGAIDDLIPMLSEREQAQLVLEKSLITPDLLVRELIQLYENLFGMPPTSRIAQDMTILSAEIKDMTVWRSVFQYAATSNKRNWEYIRKMLQNPSPALFEPLPINDLARYAFNEYKRRISRGVLDEFVAREINILAGQVTEQAKWEEGFNKAASANALNWNYLKSVISNPQKSKAGEGKDGRRKQGSAGKQRGVSRRPQVDDYSEAEREAARERARQRIAERASRRTPSVKPDTGKGN